MNSSSRPIFDPVIKKLKIGISSVLDVETTEKEDRLRLATEAKDFFAWEIDIKAEKIAWSGNSHRVLGCDPKDISDNPSQRFFFASEQDRPRLLKDFEAFKRRDDIDKFEVDFCGLSKNDEEIIWHLEGKLSRDEFGALSRAFATTQNVTKQKAIQAHLQLMTERLAIAEEVAGALIYDWDIATNKMWRSQGLTRLLGWSPGEVSEDIEGWTSLRHPDDEQRLKTYDLSYLQADDKYHIEYRIRHRDGHYIWVADSGRAYRNAAGEITRFAGATFNISDRRQAEAYNARLAAVALSSHDALFGLTLNGVIETWNPAAEQLFGYSAAEAIGQNVSILASAGQREQQKAQIAKVLASDKVEPYEALRMRKDGSFVDVAVALAPVRSAAGKTTSISVAIHDITERKLAQAQQILMTRELAHRNKNSFAILQGILRSTLKKSLNPDDFATAFSGRLHSLAAAQDVLTASDWKATELGALIRLQLAAHLPTDDQRIGFSTEVINLPPGYASPLGLIFNELTTNALKFGALTSPNGTVKISWSSERLIDGSLKIMIAWCERGGPQITSNIVTGFGLTIIQKSLADAIVINQFDPEGLTCKIELTVAG